MVTTMSRRMMRQEQVNVYSSDVFQAAVVVRPVTCEALDRDVEVSLDLGRSLVCPVGSLLLNLKIPCLAFEIQMLSSVPCLIRLETGFLL